MNAPTPQGTAAEEAALLERKARRAAADVVFKELLTPAGREDPYSRYARLREIAPVHASRLGPIVLTRYEDCNAVLRNQVFGVHDEVWLEAMFPNWRDRPALATVGRSLVFHNPPDHTRLRRLVQGRFTVRRVQAMQAEIEHLVQGRLDAIADAGADGSPVDLGAMLALPLPVAVIAALVGIPETDWPWVAESAADLTPLVDFFASSEDLERSDKAAAVLVPYFLDLAAQRRRAPTSDLISALTAAADDGDALTDSELAETVILLFAAGFETSVSMITNGALALLRHPAQLELFRARPELAQGTVEEILRYDTPVQGVSRMARTDTEIADVRVRRGKEVWAIVGAANRDPAQFPDPDRFDITRTGTKVASFGGGVHLCIGASLGRLEGAVTLPALFRRFPRLALASEPVRRSEFNVRGFSSFAVSIR